MGLGGNIGAIAMYMAKKVGPSGHVYVYEPDPDNFKILRENIRVNGVAEWVTPVEVGLWDEETTLSFTSTGDYTSSFVETDYVQNKVGSGLQVEIPVTTIDKEVNRLGISELDLVKMDIEGSEPNALRGGRDTLRRLKPRLIVESHTVAGRCNAQDIVDELETAGYQVKRYPRPQGQELCYARPVE